MLVFEQHKQAIVDDFLGRGDQQMEHCGVILQDGIKTEYRRMLNVARFSEDNFEFDPAEWDMVRSRCMCIVHSHWSDEHPGHLTAADIESARILQVPIAVYHTGFKCWDYWDPDEWHPHPMQISAMQSVTVEDFVGWPFVYGRSDCWSLVRGWYIGKLGILLKDYSRGNIEQLEDEGFDPFDESFVRFGFTEVGEEDIQDNDVLIFRMGRKGECTHCAVVVDAANGVGLHTLGPDMLSTTFAIDRWKNRLHTVMRYQGCK
jgi:hypothetical protein